MSDDDDKIVRPTEFQNHDPDAKSKIPDQRGRRPKEIGERTLLTAKQELFCKARADGHSKAQAYRMAYPGNEQPASDGYKLEQLEHIQKRIKELSEERAWAAKLVDPQESLTRWNVMYLQAMEHGDYKMATECQKQIDKINGAEAAVVRQQLEVKGLFRGDSEEDWKEGFKRLQTLLQSSDLPTKQ